MTARYRSRRRTRGSDGNQESSRRSSNKFGHTLEAVKRFTAIPSPRILRLEWGKTEVEELGAFKDVKLWPGGGREWDWRETGTEHVPGIRPADVQELIDHGAAVIVLSRGMQLRLQTRPETLEVLDRLGVEVQVEESKAAAEIYNRLAGSRPAGCLIHSTC